MDDKSKKRRHKVELEELPTERESQPEPTAEEIAHELEILGQIHKTKKRPPRTLETVRHGRYDEDHWEDDVRGFKFQWNQFNGHIELTDESFKRFQQLVADYNAKNNTYAAFNQRITPNALRYWLREFLGPEQTPQTPQPDVRVPIPPETDDQRYRRYVRWVNRYNQEHGTNFPVHLQWEHLDDDSWQVQYDALSQQHLGINVGTHLSATMSKRPHLDVSSTQNDEESSGGATGAAIQHAHRLFGIHYYKCDFTITRKQHITLAQYKPGESGITQYYVTCLPLQLFDFWVEADDGGRWRDPFHNICKAWDYIAYNDAHIRLSHFIPLQNSLQGSAQQDQPAFNTAPYCYIAQDNMGMIQHVESPTAITHQTMVEQQLKIPSNAFWIRDNDAGLLGLDDVKTLHQNETLYLNFKFDNQCNRFKRKRPMWQADHLHYLPMTVCDDDGHPISGHVYTYNIGAVAQHTVTNVDVPYTFLFLPYIEKVSAAENATRLYAHMLMETKINVTLWSIPDGAEQLGFNKQKGTLDSTTTPITNKILHAQAFQF